MNKIQKYIDDPWQIILFLNRRKMFNWMPDKLFLKLIYRARMKKRLNIENPVTYNEKLQWLKLYDRKDEYTMMVDKYGAKKYVADRIGEDYIIPTLGVWDKFEDIDFDKLPEKFVLKCTHDSGGFAICKDKAKFDKKDVRDKFEKSLKTNYFYNTREWPYKNVKPRIIAEKYLENLDNAELVEYKIFCFNGTAKIVLVCKGAAHGSGRTNDYCDRDLSRYPFKSLNPNSTGDLEVPKQLPELIEFAEKLAVDIPQVRVDTYLVDGKIYFGEMTFFHNSGMCKFKPEEWDKNLGDWIVLPERGI